VWLVLLGALALSVAPGIYMLSLSFMDNPQLFSGRLVPWPLHPENYPRAWVASNIGRLYWNSIYVSTASMVATVAISALAGYGLGRIRFAGRGLVYGIVLIGLTIPLQVALIPLFMNLRTLGLLNTPFAPHRALHGFGLAFGTFAEGFFKGCRCSSRRRGSTARASSGSSLRDASADAPGLATVDLRVLAELERVSLRADLHHRGRMRTLPTGIALLSSEFYGTTRSWRLRWCCSRSRCWCSTSCSAAVRGKYGAGALKH
jgi:hypothetical protein